MFEKFTERARKVMSLARQHAQRLDNDFIGTEHILLGIIEEGGGLGSKMLKTLAGDQEKLKAEVERQTQKTAQHTPTLGQIPFSPRSKRVIELAGEFATKLEDDVIGTEHLLLGLINEGEGVASKVLSQAGVKLSAAIDKVKEFKEPAKAATQAPSYRYTPEEGYRFQTPKGIYLSVHELVALVQGQVVTAKEVRNLVWGE